MSSVHLFQKPQPACGMSMPIAIYSQPSPLNDPCARALLDWLRGGSCSCVMLSKGLPGPSDSENLARREHEAQLRKDKRQLDTIIKDQPHLAAIALRHLHNLGLDLTPGAKPEVGPQPSKQAAGAIKRKNSLEKAKVDDDASPPAGMAWNSDDKISTCYLNLGELSMKLLAGLLTRLNPVSFSAANLRAKHGQAQATKEVYLRLIEFTTGLDSQTALRGNLRWWPGLHQACDDGVEKLGDRAARCLVHPDWASAGVYRLQPSPRLGYIRLSHMNGTWSDLSLAGWSFLRQCVTALVACDTLGMQILIRAALAGQHCSSWP